MAVTVTFKTQSGINNTRIFERNQGVSVYGKCTGVAGIGEPGTHVRLEVKSGNQLIHFEEDITNIWGDYDFWFRTPNFDGRLNVMIIATYSISGQDVVNIPIGVNVSPGSTPLPEGEMAWLSFVPILLLLAGGIILINKKG